MNVNFNPVKTIERACAYLEITPNIQARILDSCPDGEGYLVAALTSLHAISGGDREFMRHWLNSENTALRMRKPIDAMLTEEGLIDVHSYLARMASACGSAKYVIELGGIARGILKGAPTDSDVSDDNSMRRSIEDDDS